MHHIHGASAEFQTITIVQVAIERGHRWRGDAQPFGLFGKVLVQRNVGFVDHGRRTGELLEHGQRTDVIDVRVRGHDGTHLEAMPLERCKDAFAFVTRVDDDRALARLSAQKDAVALQRPDRNVLHEQDKSELFVAARAALQRKRQVPQRSLVKRLSSPTT